MTKYVVLLLMMISLSGCATLFGPSNGSSQTAGYNEAQNSCRLMLNARSTVGNNAIVTQAYTNYQSYLAVLLGQSDAVNNQIIASQYDYSNRAKLLNCGPMLKEPQYCSNTYMIYSESYQKEKTVLTNYNQEAYKKGFSRALAKCQKQMAGGQ